MTTFISQVVLQSETIQELTKTSETLALLQEEASKLRKLADSQKIENVKYPLRLMFKFNMCFISFQYASRSTLIVSLCLVQFFFCGL